MGRRHNEGNPPEMLTTKELTLGERLLIERRRLDQNQTEAAKAYGVSEWTYRQCESDEYERIPAPPVGRIEPREACMLMRRRAGMQRTELAEKLKISCWWLTQMEHGSVSAERLVKFWS